MNFESAAGDTWAFMYITTTLLTGLIIVGMLLISPPALWTGRVVVLPLALVVILGSLPYRKGVAIAVEHLIDRRLVGASERDSPEASDVGALPRRDNAGQ